MTAEVAVLNRHAIALAADSAVTVHGQKVFNTANKIFALSHVEPVAVMVYGSGDLLGVPWEVLAKLYREHLGQSAPDALEAYVDGLLQFLGHLARSGRLFGESDQESHLCAGVAIVFDLIRDRVDRAVDRRLAKGALSSDDVLGLVAGQVRQLHHASRSAALRPSVTEATERDLSRAYRAAIVGIAQGVFERLPLNEAVTDHLVEVGIAAFTRAWLPSLPLTSGVVVAGYGASDVFPRLRHLEIHGILGGHLLYDHRLNVDISTRDSARVVPFAQQQMVYRFMEGIDPDYRDFIEDEFAEVWAKSLRAVLHGITELTREQREHYSTVAASQAEAELRRYLARLREYGRTHFADPVMDMVSSLPKDELGDLAESLVNLTSLRHRLSSELETVGGPVDVAVISKGDGLVWIKRKHYFRGELNPQFLARYARRGHDGTTER